MMEKLSAHRIGLRVIRACSSETVNKDRTFKYVNKLLV